MTGKEVAHHYPCDDVVAAPSWQAWRGVTVHATRREVWPWLKQIELAPYFYNWIDNLGRRSPQQLPDLPEPAPGAALHDRWWTPDRSHRERRAGSTTPRRIMSAVMSYVLLSPGTSTERRTRLVLKVVGAHSHRIAPLLSIGDLVMARRQLLNPKRLAEQSTAESSS